MSSRTTAASRSESNGLGTTSSYSDGACLVGVDALEGPAQPDERDRGQLFPAPQGPGDVVAVPPGKRQADDERIGPEAGHGLEERGAVLEHGDPEFRLGEGELDRLLDRRAGVGHDDLVGHVDPQKIKKIVSLEYRYQAGSSIWPRARRQ